ncbi:MAG: hypothetical protein HZA34_04550 [Candidatus Pacebacteria bacterium]|nr:hypothetical protein [Candidatus Paceibacterota bacterium]
MSEQFTGYYRDYEDERCLSCALILDRENLRLCRKMVLMTTLQIAAATAGNTDAMVEYERLQNKIALQLLCDPGFDRI